MTNKINIIIWKDFYNKPTDSFIPNHPQHYSANILFSLARRIDTIVENENVKKKKKKCFKELKKKIITRTKMSLGSNKS